MTKIPKILLLSCVNANIYCSMLEKILPEKIFQTIKEKVNFKSVNEVRLRAGKPVVINAGGKMFFLSEKGLTGDVKQSMFATKIMIEDVIFRASECSIYSVNEQIKKGYIMTDDGVRIGIGGNLIEENGKVKTMSNFSSCNIRIPHIVKNCSLGAFAYLIAKNEVLNTLVVSPPACGKTTFLRDFVSQLSSHGMPYNVLLLDERGELDCGIESNFTDKIAFASKKDGFENGVRALSPDIIVTDEIGQEDDIMAIHYATSCGVKLLASVHSDSMDALLKKHLFKSLLEEKVFKRFVFLSKRNGPGTLEGIYDENLARIYR